MSDERAAELAAKRDEIIGQIEAGVFPLSFSKLRAFQKSPDYFLRYCLKETRRTKAMRFGSMLHCLVLEPERFKEFYAVSPDGVKLNTNEGRETYFEFLRGVAGDLSAFETELGRPSTFRDYKALAEWLELSKGLEFVSAADKDRSREMAGAIMRDGAARSIIEGATETERAIEFEFEGWKWRGKIDIQNGSHIADLKKVVSADPRSRSLKWNLRDDGYFVQQYIYRVGLGEPGQNKVVCVDEDLQVSVLTIGEQTMFEAEADFRRTMSAFERCRLLGNWGESFGFWSDLDGEFEI